MNKTEKVAPHTFALARESDTRGKSTNFARVDTDFTRLIRSGGKRYDRYPFPGALISPFSSRSPVSIPFFLLCNSGSPLSTRSAENLTRFIDYLISPARSPARFTFTRGIACRRDRVSPVFPLPPRVVPRALFPYLSSSYHSSPEALSTLLYISRSFPLFPPFVSLFFFFRSPFLMTARRLRPQVYLRSADAHNGRTKVTGRATDDADVGLRGGELQTIAGLRDDVIVFLRASEGEERDGAITLSHCCPPPSKGTFVLLIRARRAVV